jgi:hypothetical protein
MKIDKSSFGIFTVLFIILLAGCASTQITTAWKDKAYTGGPLKNVMVICVSEKMETRKMFEEHFVESFKSHGVNAVTSFSELPADKEAQKEMIKRKAQELGMEAVFITHLVGVKEKEIYHPPTYDAYPPSYYRHFGHYYNHTSWYHRYSGYHSTHEAVHLESNLYNTATEALIWMASSETLDAKDVQQVIDSLSVEVMKNLRKNGLIAK